MRRCKWLLSGMHRNEGLHGGNCTGRNWTAGWGGEGRRENKFSRGKGRGFGPQRKGGETEVNNSNRSLAKGERVF